MYNAKFFAGEEAAFREGFRHARNPNSDAGDGWMERGYLNVLDPQWEQKVRSEAFRQWVETLPAGKAKKVWDDPTAVGLHGYLTEFDRWQEGRAATGDDFVDGFNSVRGKR